jgi:hypothetical protein
MIGKRVFFIASSSQFRELNVSLKFGPGTKLRGLPEKRTGLKTLPAAARRILRKEAIANANKEREGRNAIALFARIMD